MLIKMSDDLLSRLKMALSGLYSVEREVGCGAMAHVLLARDEKHDRQVAIKVLRPELTSSLGPERFLREIQLAAKLNHPHILPLYDSGEADGFLYFVMPFVEGESLGDLMKREGQQPLLDSLRITCEVAEALHYAHGHGVVHRDIKPDNIMITDGHAVVTDFGIARALDVAGGEKLTQTGLVVGTPAYMSPEQVEGGDALDGRTDVYSLGCVLFEMLVGEIPFTGPTPVVIIARHAMDSVTPPSIMRETVPPELDDVVICAMAKSPADRFHTAGEFAVALRVIETGTGTMPSVTTSVRVGAAGQGRIDGRRSPTGRWSRRSIAGIAATAVAGLLLLWQFGIRSGSSLPLDGVASRAGGLPVQRVAVLYFDDVSRDASLGYLVDGLTEALIDELSLVPALDILTKNGALQFRGSDLPHDSIARAVSAGTVVSGTIGLMGDNRVRVNVVLADGESGAEFRRETFERPSADLFGMQADLAQEVAGLLRGWLGEEIELRSGRQSTESVAAWALYQRGERARKEGEARLLEDDLDAFVTAFLAADSMLAEAEREDPEWARPPTLRGHLARRWAQLSDGDPLEAGEWIEQGFGHVERGLALDATNAEVLETRGMLRYLKWALSLEADPTAAGDLLRTAEEDLNTSVRYDPTRANAWNVLSIIHAENNRSVESKITALRAYEEDAYLQAADAVLWGLYVTSYDLEQFPDAVQYCAEGRRRFPENPDFVECELWLLASRAQEPDVDRAWELLSRFEQLSPPQTREHDRLRGRIMVGGVLARAELADSANNVFLSARVGPDVDPTQELIWHEAIFRIQMGEQEEAIRLIRTYLTTNPEHRAGFEWTSHWWWREIQDNTEFQQLVGG